METVIDAVNELIGQQHHDNLIGHLGWTYYYPTKGACNTGYSFHDEFVCTFDEFSKCVDEMSKAEWIKPKAEAKPVYTQAMADNGELPIAGMECMISDETYSAEYFSGVILFVGISNTVWTHGKVEYSQSSQYLNFKPITPPIDLIDGEAYKFIYNGKFNIGIYDSDDGRFYFPRGYVLSSYPTNIKHLTV